MSSPTKVKPTISRRNVTIFEKYDSPQKSRKSKTLIFFFKSYVKMVNYHKSENISLSVFSKR